MSSPWHFVLLAMTFGACAAAGLAAGLGVLLCLYKVAVAIAAVIHRKRWERARLAEHKAAFTGFQEEFKKWKFTDGRWNRESPDDDRGDPTLTTGGHDD